ncbi:TonB-dependent receptor [Sphingomonas sp. ac-8]|uniref:TonB-dependent receptor n=1 Tax=Sphingomonas sp. ac-8 TaxID=3242977 RepID=UPI003A7FB631
MRHFDIASQQAATAIPLFAKQAGILIIASSDVVEGVVVRKISGTMDTAAALDALLAGTGLTTVRVGPSIAVKRSRDIAKPVLTASAVQMTPVQQQAPSIPAPGSTPAPQDEFVGEDIVVTGVRQSLEKAAQIKRNADQVVDSIVAEDIGRFPDPTVASALQRVPGVQVTVAGNNEIASPIIRGLGDILTTVDGREIFTGIGRGFAFRDLPAEALAGADVYKSSSAELIEGGVAGAIDLKLHQAFDFRKLTVAGTARATYAPRADAVNPTIGLLVANRWDTGIGEIGALFDVSYSDNKFSRQTPFNGNFRGRLYPISGADGIVQPTAANLLNSNGDYQRPQANLSLQWQANDALQVYVNGLFAGYRTRFANNYSFHDVFNAQSISDVVVNDDCADYQVGANSYYNPNGTVRRLCTVSSYTANNTFGQAQAEARHQTTNLYLAAGGFRYDEGALHANVDVSWQRSRTRTEQFTVVIGKPIAALNVRTDVDGGLSFDSPGNPMGDPSDFRFAQGLNQNYDDAVGELFAIKGDASVDLDGVVQKISGGFRYASRDSTLLSAYLGKLAPGGDYATPIASVALPADFLDRVDYPGRVNGGGKFVVPRTSYLLDNDVQDVLRAAYGVPLGRPAYQPERGFDASEKTLASYVQAKYAIDLGGAIAVDGLVGLRLTRTTRDVAGSGVVTAPDGVRTVTPVQRSTQDTDLLPNLSARVQFGGGLQARLSYAKAISRPDFASLNPGLNYALSTNASILNSGSAGNPELRPQSSDSIDGSLEYYFGRRGYVAIVGYYKDIADRVTSTVTRELIGGVEYNISRPRNIGSAKLRGLEVSGQLFMDFLPGALSGIGAFGNYTLADSEVTTPGDRLFGLPLTGVSKHSFNLGLLYEKYGFHNRVVYTYRSKFAVGDLTQAQDVRPTTELVYLNENRAYGRLDFGLSYDLTPRIVLNLDGTNVLNSKTRSYRAVDGRPLLPRDYSFDDSTYSVGLRFNF